MDIVVFALAGLGLVFVVISLSAPLAEMLRLPLTVTTGCMGLAAGTITYLLRFDVSDGFLDSYNAWLVRTLSLDAQTLLVVFLPPLLYEMALGVNVRRLLDDVVVVIVMAVVAVVLATAFVGLSLWLASPLGLLVCLLLGATISTTDPAAVITTFRDLGAPRRLLVILEGESLLNDAAAIAIFGTLVALARAQAELDAGAVLSGFLYDFVAGAGVGAALGWLASRTYPFLGASAAAEATLTVALAYGSYLVADQVLDASGVVAVVFAGLVTTSVGVVRMGPRNWNTTLAVWSQIGFWASNVILLFAAALAPHMLAVLDWQQVLLLVVIYLAALCARAIVLFALLPLLAAANLGAPITVPQKLLITWGGVRGAVTLVLAIALGEITAIDEGQRQVIAALAAGFVFLTLMVNAATLRLVTRQLGLDRLSEGDIALRERIVAATVEDIRRYVTGMARDRAIEPEAVQEMRDAYETQIRQTIRHADDSEIAFGERLRLGLTILANQELQLIQRAFEEEAIGPRITIRLRAAAERLSDTARVGGREAYEEAANELFAPHIGYRTAVYLQRYLRFDRPLRAVLSRHLNLLLETENILGDLRRFIPEVLAPMVGDDAAENLSGLIGKRIRYVQEQITIVSRQYPRYTEEAERILLLRAAARRELTQYRSLRDDGIIGVELFRDLVDDLARRRRPLDSPPPLDLGLSPIHLVEQVALFATLSAQQRTTIAQWLKAEIAMPSDIIVSAGERGHAMYFIASGVLEVRGLDKPVYLSNGDFFGELALLAPTRKRQTTIVAASYCRLLTLSRRDFRRVTALDPEIEKTIRAAAERQLGEGFRGALPEEADWSGGGRPYRLQ